MHLANPHALWLLCLLPLLWLRRTRQPRSKALVANLYLWSESTKPDAWQPWRRFLRSRLVPLQAAVLAAIVLALARPMLTSGARVVAIVLDTSIEMGARQDGATRMDAARQRVSALLDELPRWTTVRLVEADAVPRVVGEFAAHDPALARAIGLLQVTDAAADVDAAIQRAQRADPRAARTYVFTAAAIPPARRAAASLEWIRIAKPIENLAVTQLGVRRTPSNPSVVQLLAEIRNYGASTVRSDIGVTVGDEPPMRTPFTVEAGGRATIVNTIPATAAVVTATIGVSDALDADNERRIVVGDTDRLRVRLEGGSSFIANALATHPDVVLVERAPYDAIVCDGCVEPPPGDAGAIVIPPRSAPASAATLTIVNRLLPGPLTLDGLPVIPITLGRADDEGVVVARAGGVPVIVAREPGGRRVLELRFDPDTSPLRLLPQFPILVGTALDWVSPVRANRTSIVAGEPLHWVVPESGTPSMPVVIGPDGRRVDASIVDGRMVVPRTSMAGVYRVQRAEGERRFVANPASDREAVVPEPDTDPTRERERASDVGARPRDAAAFLLVAALVLLAVEWHWTGRRRRT